MESYANYAPPKKNNTGLIIGLVIGGILLCCIGPIALIGGFGYWGFNKAKGFFICSMAYMNMDKAVDAYAKDHGGKLPHSATWMDDLRPYYSKVLADRQGQGKQQPFGDLPAGGNFTCESDGRQTGMAFNAALDGKAIKSIKSPETTVVLFETDSTGVNLSEKYVARPMQTSPKAFNKPRGWLTVTLDGDVRFGSSSFREGSTGGAVLTSP